MRNLTILILFIGGSLSQGYSQTVRSAYTLRSLEDAWTLASENNVDIQNEARDIENAELDVKLAKARRLPSINGSFSLQNNLSLATTPLPGEIFGQPGETINAQFGQDYNWNAGITVNKSLFNLQEKRQVRLAEQGVSLSQAQEKLTRQTLREQIAQQYYTILILEKGLALDRQNLELMDSLENLSQQKLDEGLIDASALYQAELNKKLVEESILERERMLNQSNSQLKTLLGVDTSTQIEFQEEIEGSGVSEGSLDLAPDALVAVYEKQYLQAEHMLRVEKAAYWPSISSNAYFGQQQFRNDFGLSFQGSDWNPYNYLGFTLQVPIFQGGQTRKQVKKAQNDWQIAENTWKDVQRESIILDQQLIEQDRLYRELANNTQERYEVRQKQWELSEQRYEEGIISLDTHLLIFEDYLQAENIYLNSLLNVYLNYSSIISRREKI